MNPIAFPESNTVFRGGAAEKYGTADDVADLPAYHGYGLSVSCWRPTWRERLGIALGKPVWLSILGRMPPVKVATEYPFESGEESKP